MEIQFACIEYNTKSGSIWRPTPERPNYLCDPKNEIDIGSFGSWTSALKGEHIPLHWFMDGKPRPGVDGSSPFQKTLFYRFGTRLIKEIFPDGNRNYQFHNLGYLEKFNPVLVCFSLTQPEAMTQFLQKAKERYPEKIFLVTYGTFNLGRVREYWRDPSWFRHFVTFLNTGDLIILVNREAREYLQLVTKKPILYFPTFYPVHYTEKFFVPREEKEKKIFVAGTTERMDIVWSCLIAKVLQERYPDFTIQVCSWKNMNFEPLKGTRYEVLPWLQWEDYLKVTGKAMFILNTDTWWTNGRVPSDAAAVGTPCIGVNADRQKDLFPDLTCSDVMDTKKALQLGARLIDDNKFYEFIQNKAYQRLEIFSYENSRERFHNLIESYKIGNLDQWKE